MKTGEKVTKCEKVELVSRKDNELLSTSANSDWGDEAMGSNIDGA